MGNFPSGTSVVPAVIFKTICWTAPTGKGKPLGVQDSVACPGFALAVTELKGISPTFFTYKVRGAEVLPEYRVPKEIEATG